MIEGLQEHFRTIPGAKLALLEQSITGYCQLLEGLLKKAEVRQRVNEHQIQEMEEKVNSLIAAIDDVLREELPLIEANRATKGQGKKKLKSIEEVYSFYEYHPSHQEHERINVNLSLSPEQRREFINNSLTDLEHYLTTNEPIEKSYSIGKELELEILIQRSFYDNKSVFMIHLSKNKSTIAEFHVSIQEPKWVLNHRIVKAPFRRQKIGSFMLGLFEEIISIYGKKNGKTQEMVIESRQVDLLFFAQKNGYHPKTEKDNENMRLLLEGHRERILIAEAIGFNREGSLQGYVFDKNLILEQYKYAQSYSSGERADDQFKYLNIAPAQLSNEDFNKIFSEMFRGRRADPEEYFAMGLTIHLVKKLSP